MTIKVVDNFLDEDMLSYVQELVFNLKYRVQSSTPEGPWNFLTSAGPFIEHDVFKWIARKIDSLEFINVKDYNRVYANCNASGSDNGGKWHRDDGSITALFYPMEWDSKTFKGGTEFEDGTVVDYVTNRIVFFDAKIKHRAQEHFCKDHLRYTVAYKINAGWNNG